MNKKDNIFYFFLLALALHLSLFIVNQKGVKGDAPVSLKTNSAPISVRVKSPVVKKESVVAQKEVTPPTPPKEEKKPEPKKIEPPKKEIVKPDVKSKIKDKKKKVEKQEKKVEKKPTEKPQTTKKEEKLPPKQVNETEEILASGNFSVGKDGIFTASSSDGIEYKILKQVEPDYPIQAERIRYRNRVVVSARFLVGLKGEIEKVEITQSHKKFGFDDEVQKALKQWKFHPIYYKNKNIKVYFTKDFIFEPK